jgi:hypothetical protein
MGETLEQIGEKAISKIDEKAIEAAEKAFEKEKSTQKNKLYAVELSVESLDAFEGFIKTKAKWMGAESLGILELINRIEKIRKEGIKNKVCYMNNLEIDAANHFLNRHVAEGYDEAKEFFTYFRPLNQALGKVKGDTELLKSLENKLNALRQGIESDI